MSKESLLKKDFKQSDIQRVRNIVNKDFSSKTKAQTGYRKTTERHTEGDVWEESGKVWTIKNGLKQNVTKLDSAKKLARVPLTCPKCNGPMKHWLAKKMYRIHGFCYDPCTLEYESTLKKAGLYEQYEKRLMQGNLKFFVDDIEQWVTDLANTKLTFVTEQGDVEDWKDSKQSVSKLVENVKEYTDVIRKQLS